MAEKRWGERFRAMLKDRRTMFLAGLSALVGGFILLADEVTEGDTTAFDNFVLLALRSPEDPSQPLGPPWLREAMRDVTALGSFSVLFLFVAIACLYLLVKRRTRTALFILVSVLLGTGLSSGLKLLFNRARPDLPGLPTVFTASFPSGHAALSAVVFLTLGLLLAESERDPAIRILLVGIAIVLTLLVGVSRVLIGVHYPTDVLAGWCLGIAWAVFCQIAMEGWRRRG